MYRSVLLLGAVACSSSSSAGEPPAAGLYDRLPALSADERRTLLEHPEALGPKEGTPCSPTDGWDAQFGPIAAPPELSEPVVIDAGREPRVALRRGAPRGSTENWVMTIDETQEALGASEKPFRKHEVVTFAVEPGATESRLRYRMTSHDIQLPDEKLSDQEGTAFEVANRQMRAGLGAFREVPLDATGQPSREAAAGDRSQATTARLGPVAARLPTEPLGVGATWVTSDRHEGVQVFSTFRVADLRDGVATIEASIVVNIGRMSMSADGPRVDMWSVGHHTQTWTVDPRTPVTAFRSTSVLRLFTAFCREGRIELPQQVVKSSVTFAPAR